RGSERAGLIASGVECHPPVNHHADRPPRHDEQNDNHGLRQDAHLLPERNRVPTDRALVKEPGGEKMEITECDCCQVHYHELLSSSRTVSNFKNCFELPKISPWTQGLPRLTSRQETRQAASLRQNRRRSKISLRPLAPNRLMQENQCGQNCPRVCNPP